MTIKKNMYAVVGATLLSLPAMAFADNYVGANAAAVDLSADGVSEELSLTAVYGRVGTELSEYFSAELRLGAGVNDDSIDVSGTELEVELKSFAGAYVRAGIPNTTRFFPYAVLGYTYGKLEASFAGENVSDSESDVSFGVGTDFQVNETWSINAEYINYFDKDGTELEGFSVGFTTTF